MNRVACIGMFVIGAAMGAGVTWRFIKQKYERIAQEEIDSVKAVYGKSLNKAADDVCKTMSKFRTAVEETRRNNPEFDKLLDDYGGKEDKPMMDNPKDSSLNPYVISPDEFGEDDEYETISLCYYADGVLTDDNDEPIENVDEIVGVESLTRFGEYEDDSVFVRNKRLKTDYEILLDLRPYSEVAKGKPHYKEAQ